MKHWYQYRCEEVTDGSDSEAYCLIDSLFSFTPGKADGIRIAKRLKRFLFIKCHMGGIRWQFQAGFIDWCAVYGTVEK